MAKDPAVLWYWNDWNGGTMTLTRHQKGCYMDLLAAQFNSGPLSLEQIKTVLGQDQAVWTVLQAKFKKVVENGTDLFFNERMETERKKRAAFSLRQLGNGSKGGRPKKTQTKPMGLPDKSLLEDENEDENKIEVQDRGSGEGWNTRPGPDQISLVLPEIKAGAVIQFLKITKNVDATPKQVESLWEIFKIQNFTGENFYQSPEKVFSHFINWSKTQDINGNKNGQTKQGYSHRAVITGTAESAGSL